MPHMIGDFDDNANALWSLHTGEAKRHDEGRIHSLKDDMDSVLIFVRIYIPIVVSTELIRCHPGWFIFRCPYFLSFR